jgi:hypothetical protein
MKLSCGKRKLLVRITFSVKDDRDKDILCKIENLIITMSTYKKFRQHCMYHVQTQFFEENDPRKVMAMLIDECEKRKNQITQ